MNKKGIVLTGDRPTGPLHLGHYIGSLKSRLDYQETADQFVLVADVQALTDHVKTPEKVRKHVLEVAYDYLAIGLDPSKTTFCIQSMLPALFELTVYYLNFVTWNRLKHNPTVKQEIQQKGFGESVPAGFMVYPISQAADITAFKADIVPVGEDQRPMIEQTNEVVRHFNQTYNCEVLVPCKAIIPTYARLPGTDGNAKMSKSLNNAIYLSEESDSLKKKVMKMQSDPDHVRLEDPGKVEGNPVFEYLDAFGTDKAKIQELKDHYARGGLGDSVLKRYLHEVLEELLDPIRKKRAEYASDPGGVMEILKKGTARAHEVTQKTLEEVRQTMHLNYELHYSM